MKQPTVKYYSNKILELLRKDCSENDKVLISEAVSEYAKGNYSKLDSIFEQLSDDYKLLEALISKLKGKSVYTGLKQLVEGKDQSNEQAIISTSSLISHVAIEMKGHKQYRRLLPDLYRKLGVLISRGD